MSIDFNAQYKLNTSIGNLLVALFYYDGNIASASGYLSNTLLYYMGQQTSNLTVSYSYSVLWGSKYRQDNFPIMNQITVLDRSQVATTFTISEQTYSTGARLTLSYSGVTKVFDANGEGARNFVSCIGLAVIVDANDNFILAFINTRNNESNVAYTPNTQNAFGFFEGAGIESPPFNATGYFSNFSTTFEPLLEVFRESTDPFYPGGESDTGGGEGNFDGTSVDVDFATLPTLSAVDTGFITLYNPSLTQLQSLAAYMWSGLFDINTFKKLFADPMQAILGLSIVPGPVPSGVAQNVRIGNIDSGISMTKAATQYIDVDCGTLNVEEFWGAYLDYEPYTKAEIFLPFIGVHQIAIDDIMNKAVQIKYHIDLLSGGCACEIKCGGSVLYTFIGSCAVSIPVTGSDWTNLINGVLSAASAIGTMVAAGGAAAPSALSTIASTAVNNLKPSIEKSGSISGAGGLLAGKVPVLILTRPRQALPGRQNSFTGYPAFITRSLGDLSGYTEVHSIRLSGIDGTESEIDEIVELLKGGVIL